MARPYSPRGRLLSPDVRQEFRRIARRVDDAVAVSGDSSSSVPGVSTGSFVNSSGAPLLGGSLLYHYLDTGNLKIGLAHATTRATAALMLVDEYVFDGALFDGIDSGVAEVRYTGTAPVLRDVLFLSLLAGHATKTVPTAAGSYGIQQIVGYAMSAGSGGKVDVQMFGFHPLNLRTF